MGGKVPKVRTMTRKPWRWCTTMLLVYFVVQVSGNARHAVINIESRKKELKPTNSPPKPEWDPKKGPEKSSPISQEKIPLPNKVDFGLFERKVLTENKMKPEMSKKQCLAKIGSNCNDREEENPKLHEQDSKGSHIQVQAKSNRGLDGQHMERESKADNLENLSRTEALQFEKEVVEPPAPVYNRMHHDLLWKKPAIDYIKSEREREATEEYIFERWFSNNSSNTVSREKRQALDKITDTLPKVLGVDMDRFSRDHPNKVMRSGSATFSDSCWLVRPIEDWMRKDENLFIGINSFYTQYTEAYGIFIIGSSNVTDNGLRRACYTLKVMLASRYDLRNAYYKFFGRIALIGDGEEQTSLYEYSDWDPKYWNRRARGLGPTVAIPLTSAGDDNQRCKPGDRYFDQDIFVHEMGHGVHLLGAAFVIPGFQTRLHDTYEKNVKQLGKWRNTYAASNMNEYFSVATQFYMNAFRGTTYLKIGVSDYYSLAEYDPDVFKLVQELYPCVGKYTRLIHRCYWKQCTLKAFKKRYDGQDFATSSGCPVLKYSDRKETVEQCAKYTCYHLGNSFQYKSPHCYVLNCPDPQSEDRIKGLMIEQGKDFFDIYAIKRGPQMNLKKENSQRVNQQCVAGPLLPEKCDEVLPRKRTSCGEFKEDDCALVGCCFNAKNKQCYFPKQDCIDHFLDCPYYAELGDCERNPVFMYQKCPLACDVCIQLDTLQSDSWKSGCQDRSLYCAKWATLGECQRNQNYMYRHCKLACRLCTAVNPLG